MFSFRLAYDFFILKRVLVQFSEGECYYSDVTETSYRKCVKNHLAHFSSQHLEES